MLVKSPQNQDSNVEGREGTAWVDTADWCLGFEADARLSIIPPVHASPVTHRSSMRDHHIYVRVIVSVRIISF